MPPVSSSPRPPANANVERAALQSTGVWHQGNIPSHGSTTSNQAATRRHPAKAQHSVSIATAGGGACAAAYLNAFE